MPTKRGLRVSVGGGEALCHLMDHVECIIISVCMGGEEKRAVQRPSQDENAIIGN